MIQQFYLDTYERYHRRGLEAHRKGEPATARRNFLKAAETLFKLAAESAGELRRTRKEKANRLLALARSIRPDETAPARGRSTAAAANGDGESEDGEGWLLAEAPDVAMDEVAGLEDVKALIRKRVVYPFEHPEVTAKYHKRAGGGVLLYGPPGTGKTMMAKAVAREIDAAFFSVRCSDVMTKWVGEAEKNIQRLFDAARAHPRAVVFLDETEAIVARRGGNSTVMNRVIPEFLSQVDGLKGTHDALLLMGATNRPWDMDEAALRPGRFGELIYVPLPDIQARRHILGAGLQGVPLAEEVDVAALAEATEGYSGADCVAVCEAAKDAPYEREISTGAAQRVEPEDLARALKHVRPSVSAAALRRYQQFHETRQ